MNKAVKAVVIGVGVAALVLAVLKIVKSVKKGGTEAPKFYAENDNEALGI